MNEKVHPGAIQDAQSLYSVVNFEASMIQPYKLHIRVNVSVPSE